MCQWRDQDAVVQLFDPIPALAIHAWGKRPLLYQKRRRAGSMVLFLRGNGKFRRFLLLEPSRRLFEEHQMKRRDFFKSTAAVSGGVFAGLHKAAAQPAGPVPGPQPNILFILVDELRYPTVFPGNIETAGEFLAKYMPNVFKLWQNGVKFGNHNTAANACTP